MIDLTAEPVVGYSRDYNGKIRTKKARWTGEVTDAGKQLVFELTVSHNTDRKCFSVYVARLLKSTSNGFAVEEYQPFRDLTRFPSIPVARFSAKALDAAFAQALDGLDVARNHPDVTKLLVAAEV